MSSATLERDTSIELDPVRSGHETPAVVELDRVSKRFDRTLVVDDVSFSIGRGEILALVGPSGAGKTTLMHLMIGLLKPTAGQVTVLGASPTAFGPREKAAIGYVPQGFVLYPSLTVEQNARFVAGLYGIGWIARRRRIKQTLKLVDLWPARRRPASAISGGMKRRLALACGLLHSPALLFVDEPTAGLDPTLRTRIWDHLHVMREAGTTIVVTTQYLDEAERCDRIGIMRGGGLIALGTPDRLREEAIGGQAVDIDTNGFDRAAAQSLTSIPGVRSVERHGWSGLRVVVDDAATATPTLADALRERGIDVESMRAYEPTFDEVFLTFVDGTRPEPGA